MLRDLLRNLVRELLVWGLRKDFLLTCLLGELFDRSRGDLSARRFGRRFLFLFRDKLLISFLEGES